MKPLFQTNLPDLKLHSRGKVRDIYDLGDSFLIISTDRLSAFDVVMNDPIPFKGRVLNQITKFWLEFTSEIVENHLLTDDFDDYPAVCRKYRDQLLNRSMIVRKVKIIPLECIIRGYISGSGWNDYKSTGSICGIQLPEGLIENSQLESPLFTPSTKAELGRHDENIDVAKGSELVGRELFEQLEKVSISIYKKCSEFALRKGIIIADTKLEFGLDENGKLILADEVLTPDSSRFWPADKYRPGASQESFDKQFVRDYLLNIGFNKQPPPPVIPADIIHKTSEKYIQAFEILTGNGFIK